MIDLFPSRFSLFIFSVLGLFVLWADLPAQASVIQAPTCGAPVQSHNGTSFGCRKPPAGGGSRYHKGTDYLCGMGSPLKAGMSGTITCYGRADGNGAGNRCSISDSSCITIKYFHMDDTGFKPGSWKVNTGDPIGVSGASGKNQRQKWGAHLHFEIWVDNVPVGAQYFFSKYAGVDVCASSEMKADLRANYEMEMAACPGETAPGSPPSPNDPETSEEGEDVCLGDEDDIGPGNNPSNNPPPTNP